MEFPIKSAAELKTAVGSTEFKQIISYFSENVSKFSILLLQMANHVISITFRHLTRKLVAWESQDSQSWNEICVFIRLYLTVTIYKVTNTRWNQQINLKMIEMQRKLQKYWFESKFYCTFVIVVFVQLRQLGVIVFGESTLRCNVHHKHHIPTVFLQWHVFAVRIFNGEIVDRCGGFVVNFISACHFFSWWWLFGLKKRNNTFSLDFSFIFRLLILSLEF